MDVIDLHCDLLAYLAINPSRTSHDSVVRCSLPQLKAGNVKTQVLAISSETTPLSLNFGLKQLELFLELDGGFLPAFENASAFSIETEPLKDVIGRLEGILTKITPLYISLTWNGENRFGGGCGSEKGLKPDGEELLQFLSGKGIFVDFSHTSDPLAHDILNFIDKKGLKIPVMASHSNFRAIHHHIRNLPDPIAQEIIAREGLIGLVFYSKFLKEPKQLYEHICYGLELGGETALAFGGDFFCSEDFSLNGHFFEEMSDASKYPSILEMLRSQGLSEEQLTVFASRNVERILMQA